MVSDNNTDRAVKDGTIAASGASCQEAGQILGVRSRGAAPADGHIRSDSSLARLHLVRNRKR